MQIQLNQSQVSVTNPEGFSAAKGNLFDQEASKLHDNATIKGSQKLMLQSEKRKNSAFNSSINQAGMHENDVANKNDKLSPKASN